MKNAIKLGLFYGVISLFAPACKTTTSQDNALSGTEPEMRPFVHAHRGGRNEGVENSSAQMLKAIDLGVDAVEFDVVGTKDGELVVKHDQFVEANCGVAKRYLRTMMIKEIAALECKDAKGRAYKIEELGEMLGLLAARLAKGDRPNLKLNIETKISEVLDPGQKKDPDYAEVGEVAVHYEVFRIWNLLREHGLENRAIIQSFDIRSLVEAQKIAPNIPRSRLFMPTGFYFCSSGNLIAKVNEELKKSPGLYTIVSPWGLSKYSWGVHAQLVDEKSVKALKALNLEIIPWTINDQTDWIRLTNYGVDAIITDEPTKFIDWRKNRVYF